MANLRLNPMEQTILDAANAYNRGATSAEYAMQTICIALTDHLGDVLEDAPPAELS